MPNEETNETRQEPDQAPVARRTRSAGARAPAPARTAPNSPVTIPVGDPFNEEDRDWQMDPGDFLPPPVAAPARAGQGRTRVSLVNLLAPSQSTQVVTGRVGTDLAAHLMAAPGFAGLQARALLGNMETRAHLPMLSPEELQARCEERLLNCRGDSRWKDLQSVWKQFLVWCQEWQDRYEQNLEHSWMIVNFLESKMATVNPRTGKPLGLPSAHRYVKDLKQISKASSIVLDDEMLEAYQAGLSRDGARKPAHQAPPAVHGDVDAAKELLTHSEAMGMELSWKTASRIGEVGPLQAQHFSRVRGNVWQVTFPYHKGDPFRLGTTITFVPKEDLRQYLEAHVLKDPSTPFSELTTARASAVLGRVRTGLTAHSIKRGALLAMLEAGVPLSLIQAIAKHKDLETLLIYLPSVAVAMAMGLHEATTCL